MADNQVLLNGLREYRDSIKKHFAQLQGGFDAVSLEWKRLETVYHGDAADEFRGLWMRTGSSFQEYLDRTQAILQVLDERISALEQAERSGN